MNPFKPGYGAIPNLIRSKGTPIMNASTTFRPAIRLGVAAALGIGAASLAFGLEPIRLGSPQAGLVCPSGYVGALTSGNFKCTKTRYQTLDLSCNRAGFTRYVVRAAGSPGTPDGRDICTPGAGSGVLISSTDSVVNLVRGQDYVLAGVNDATVTTIVADMDQQEATAMSLQANEVDTVLNGSAAIQPDQGTGSRDRAVVQLTHYVFGKPTGNVISAATR